MFSNSQRQWLILIAFSLIFCLMLMTLSIENLPSISAQGGATPNEATYQAATLQKLIEQERGTSVAQQTASAAAQTGPSLAELQMTARAALTLTAQSVPAISLMPATVITEKNKVGIRSVAFSPTAPVLAYGSQGGQIYLWNLATSADAATLEGHSGPVNSLAFSPDGRTLASGGADGTVRLWNMATGSPVASLQKHSGSVNSVAFKPDGTLLASAGDDATVRLWDVQIRQELASLQAHKGLVHAVAFSPDGNILASAGSDGGTILWDVGSRTQQALLAQGSEVFSVAFSPDKTVLATGSGEGIVQLWNLTDHKELRRFEIGPSLVVGLAFSTDSNHLAAAIDSLVEKAIRVWDAHTGKEEATLRDHAATIRSLAFSRDGRLMVSASDDGTARLWSIASGSLAVSTLTGRKATIAVNKSVPLYSKPQNDATNMITMLFATNEFLLLGRTSNSKWILVMYRGQRAWLEAGSGAIPDSDIATLPVVTP